MYKVVRDGIVLDVGEEKRFVKFQKNGVTISCDEAQATGIISSDGETIYSLDAEGHHGDMVSLEEISEAEYNHYKEQLSTGTEVEESSYTDLLNNVDVLSYVISLKIAEMSACCNQTIVNGVDVQLSDGTVKHFSLTIDDQLNLSTLQAKLLAGEELFGYHNDGGDCEFYSREDMMAIMSAGEGWKTYHVTYFNSLRKYIRALKTVEEVRAVYYGIDIPEEYQTEVLKAMLEGSV